MAVPLQIGAQQPTRGCPNEESAVRRYLLWFALSVLLASAGYAVGRASERDQTELTVVVSSADHELQEGYFSLGAEATVMAKPGSDLYKFLTRQRGHKIHIILSDASRPELRRLDR